MTFKDFVKMWLAMIGILTGIVLFITLVILAFMVHIALGIFATIVALSTFFTFWCWALEF